MTDSRWPRWAGIAGLLFVIFLVPVFFLTNAPSAGDPPAKISRYYLHHDTAVNVSGLLTYLAVFAGVWFFSWLWRYFRSFPGQEVAAVVSLVGAVIFALSGALEAGFNFAFTDHTKDLNDGALVALTQLQGSLNYPMTIVGLALFYSATGLVIYRAGAFPRWLGWVSWLFALVAIVPFVGWFAFLATPIWVLIVSVLLLRMRVDAPTPAAA